MSQIFTYTNLPTIAFALTLFIGAIAIGFVLLKMVKARKEEDKFYDMLMQAQLKEIVKEELLTDKRDLKSIWSQMLKSSKMVEPNVDDKKIDTAVYAGLLTAYAILLLITQNLLLSFAGPAAIGGFIYFMANKRINDREGILNEQIPSFLHIFKSNLQAGESADNALIGAIDNTADPLYGELLITRSYIQTGSFKDALVSLRLNTNNDSLRFLCSCIELSSEVGANLEEQVGIIDELLVSKANLERKYESAVAENTPLVYVAMVVIPLIFVYTYFSMDASRMYWFLTPSSFILIFVMAALITGAYFFVKHVLKSAKVY